MQKTGRNAIPETNISISPVAPALDSDLSLHPSRNSPVREPLAIIGIGCHFPGGATSPQAFWELLSQGVDATREVPPDRWDVRKFYDPDSKKSGKTHTRRGGYLEHLDLFDPQFFGISPREAVWLDPQQRLLLQVTWEALEDAGVVADRLVGSNTGVFIGGFTLEYQLMVNFGVHSRYELQSHSATGMMMTMLANRISYVFGFHGPSMAVDTACSGSLVAVHLACQSIWNNECSLALAGGASAMIVPSMTIAESKGGFLSPDGRCKAFDASANGYARGEGAGVVVIKPLSLALADGDPIYATIRGTAVTQDGHTKGITVPNGSAQELAMRLAYQRAGISPDQIQYIEAHGTGTPVGDPIEARAIGCVLSSGRPADEKCIIGSVKTNIGHLEAAAGVAGLIKTALALKHRQIPPHLHFRQPNVDIALDALQLHIPTTLEDWPKTDGPALAGVNSFGFGGTNAHIVLQEAHPAPLLPTRVNNGMQPYLLPLSARSPEALQALAGAYHTFLSNQDMSHFLDIVYSASLRRSHHDHRLALVAHSKEEAAERLDSFLREKPQMGVISRRTPLTGKPRIAFVCSGMGPQWWAMGRDLLNHEPVFRASIERCDTEFQRHAGWSLLAALTAPEADSRMEETEVAQPANFAIQVALADLWHSWGIEPDAVIGHSAGEVAAHYLAGALSFEDAVKVIYHRSHLQQRTSGQGRMLAVGMTIETVNRAVHDAGSGVSIAAINSPSSVTLVGEAAILEDMARQLETFQVFHRLLNGKVPYHSHFMDPLRKELLDALADLRPRNTSLPLYSTVTGTRISGRGVNARYWWQNVRATVLFASALGQMIQDGYQVFIELSPHPVLANSISELLTQHGQEGTVLPSLRRREEDRAIMLGSLGALYTLGFSIAWQTLYDQGKFVHLPAYPWQLKHYWTESLGSREDRFLASVHPLLGQRVSAVHPTWELEVNPHVLPYLADHRIQGSVLLPGAAYIEMALAAACEAFGEGDYVIKELLFRKALFLPETSDPRLQTVVNLEQATVEIYSYTPTVESRWALHATMKLHKCQPGLARPQPSLEELLPANQTKTSKEDFYLQSQEMGFQYGSAFQGVESIQAGSASVVGQIKAPASLAEELSVYRFHPALLDAAFQVLLAVVRPSRSKTQGLAMVPYLPVGVDRVRVWGHASREMQALARLREIDTQLVVGDIQIVDPEGNLLVEIEGFRAQSLEASISLSPERLDRSLYELEWQPGERSDEPDGEEKDTGMQEGSWIIFLDQNGVGEAVLKHLKEQGKSVVTVSHTDAIELSQEGEHYSLNPDRLDHFQQFLARLSPHHSYTRIVYLWGLDTLFQDNPTLAVLEQDQIIVCLAVIYLLQTLSQSGWEVLPHLWLVTRKAQSVGESNPNSGQVAIEQAPLWGLGRVIGHQEFNGMWGGLIDLDDTPVENQADMLLAEIQSTDHEDQVAFRKGQRYVARLVPSAHLSPPFPPTFLPDASYLITGGLGTLGLLVARWMVAQGARRLILMGRSSVPARSTWGQLAQDHPQRKLVRALQELEMLGATVHSVAVDVADEEQLSAFLTTYECEGWPSIRGVIHTAGIVQDELLLRMTAETFQRVLRPKVRGSWLLHHLLRDYPLDFFILFSSTGSVIASLGQGNYAAGNAFLDALASYRRSLQLPALSLGWGPWSVGMVEQLKLEEFYNRRGIDLITPEVGMQILGRALGQKPAHLVVIFANWTQASEMAPQGTLPPMFLLLGDQAGETSTNKVEADDEFLHLLSATHTRERHQVLTSYLKEQIARTFQLDISQFSAQEALLNLGMDSMMAIEVRNRIVNSVKVDIPILELLQGATIEHLATRILSLLQLDELPQTSEAASPIEEIQQLAEQTGSEELERLLTELEQAPGTVNS